MTIFFHSISISKAEDVCPLPFGQTLLVSEEKADNSAGLGLRKGEGLLDSQPSRCAFVPAVLALVDTV